MSNPKRAEAVHVETLGDEVCIYDWQRKEVHALNPTAARVWQQCDGQTSPQQIAATLAAELNVPNAEELVWLTLSKLEKRICWPRRWSSPPGARCCRAASSSSWALQQHCCRSSTRVWRPRRWRPNHRCRRIRRPRP